MTASELLNSAMTRRSKSQKDLAAALGLTEASLSIKVNRGTLKADEFIEAMDCLGYRVSLIDIYSEQEIKPLKKGIGPRVRKVIDGKLYDTEKSSAVCSTKPESGWWLELYETIDGEFFVAHYTDWAGAENFITLCPAAEADKLIAANSE